MGKTENKLRESIEELSKLPPEERLSLYECLRQTMAITEQIIITEQLPTSLIHPKTDLRISDDGYIVLRPAEVFLSYSHADKSRVYSLAKQLKDNGIKVWFDEAALKYGDSLIQRLCKAINTVDILLVVLSQSSMSSPWVQKEVEIAMTQELDEKKVKVVPILIEPIKLPGFLEGKLYADFTTPYRQKKNFPKLVDSIKAHINRL